MAQLSQSRRNQIAQVTSKDVGLWKQGIALERDSGSSIAELLCKAASDRWKLAYSFRTQANKLMTAQVPQYRSAISRYYYSMYHAMRACVYVQTEGDDYEKHSVLPLHVPPTLDLIIDWAAKLKSARLLRNRADYEAYPAYNKGWGHDARTIKKDAAKLLAVAKVFLKSKGCTL